MYSPKAAGGNGRPNMNTGSRWEQVSLTAIHTYISNKYIKMFLNRNYLNINTRLSVIILSQKPWKPQENLALQHYVRDLKFKIVNVQNIKLMQWYYEAA